MSRQVTLTLPAAGRAPWVARQVTRETLAAWQVSHLEETAVLLISELVTNAVRHAQTGRLAMALYLEADGRWLRIEVHDADPHEPRQRTPAATSCASRTRTPCRSASAIAPCRSTAESRNSNSARPSRDAFRPLAGTLLGADPKT